LSVAAKVALVRQAPRAVPLGTVLDVVCLGRSTWYAQRQKQPPYGVRYAPLRAPLERIARTHPDYGYRRTTTELREADGVVINAKVVRRLHQLWDLPLLRRTHVPAPSALRRVITQAGPHANLVAGLTAIAALAVLYTDFTELRYVAGKAWLITLLDHRSKAVLGWALGLHADTTLALGAWRRARRWLRRHGFPVAGLIVHHDRDPVFTSYAWTAQLLLKDHVRLSYALRGCGDNPEMESFHSRFKTENRSLFLEAPTLADLEHLVGQRIRYYTGRRRHSSLANQSPLTFLRGLNPQR
jgi:putative transposase